MGAGAGVMAAKYTPAHCRFPRYSGTDLGECWGVRAQHLCSCSVSTHPKQVTWKVGSVATLAQQHRAPGWGRVA